LKPIATDDKLTGRCFCDRINAARTVRITPTLQSADIVLATTDGREIRLRRITEPTAEQKSLLHRLGLSLPERLKSLSKCSADFAIA
jgi:hypothetical protein